MILFVGCSKENVSPTSLNNQPTVDINSKSLTSSGLKVAEKISGIVICTVDEDILSAAIVDYYGATQMKKMHVIEFNEGQVNNFYAICGRVRNGNQSTRFAFQLNPTTLGDSTIELFLPVAGTEQNLVGPGNGACKLKLTSVSTGYASCQNSGQAVYTATTSAILVN
jgi:hypothetical protein